MVLKLHEVHRNAVRIQSEKSIQQQQKKRVK